MGTGTPNIWAFWGDPPLTPRSIYTSPIKALSNQKFRDFRETFGDVGLLTGDVQLRPEAACLVMTTEILRSMLYNGSDVIRDLEWVIFDEVHYVNDDEVGVSGGGIPLTFPHPVFSRFFPRFFPFWPRFRRTKRRCVRVLSTPRRPVPLEHFLFTGNSSRTRLQLFQLLGPTGAFSTQGYYAAVEAKKEQSSKHAQSFGARQPTMGAPNPGQVRGKWGEYTQMSGRAGRRGLDATGTVIILCKGPVPELSDLHRMMLGRPSPLQSRFRLTYPMILLLLRAPALRPHDLMRRSFAEFPLRRDATAQTRRVAALREALAALGDAEGTAGDTADMADLPQYHRAVMALRRARAVLQVSSGGSGRTFTTLVLSEKPPKDGGAPPEPPQDVPYPEDLLLSRLFLPEGPPGHCLEQLRPEDIVGVTAKTLRVNPEILLQELRPPRGPRPRSPPPGGGLSAALQELSRLAGGAGREGGLPLLEAFGVPPGRDPAALAAAAEIRDLSQALRGFRCVHSPRFAQQYSQFAARQELLEQLEELQFQLSDQSLLLLPEYHQRLEALERLQAVAARVGRLEQQHGLGPGPDDFVAQFGFSLVQVVYEWARGMPFADIARLAPVQEGSVVRAIQRLEELLRELRQAARVVGDPALAAKMEAAAAMIKRDIVFAASLYTQ
ncbi:PREDICTED: helicase SKI2W [Sturnus vulgaris]|uniref:helicase SKI2W n=1 Tax=Sturnus vulgaris TaxID=9172 RepID=UPI00071AA43D|nr:PREDICTED: helicase SKI2W [Sturnus vulgaris]